jgi:hypothetical protein
MPRRTSSALNLRASLDLSREETHRECVECVVVESDAHVLLKVGRACDVCSAAIPVGEMAQAVWLAKPYSHQSNTRFNQSQFGPDSYEIAKYRHLQSICQIYTKQTGRV